MLSTAFLRYLYLLFVGQFNAVAVEVLFFFNKILSSYV